MIEVSDEQFDSLVAEALDSLPGEHVKNIKNVAIVTQDEPTQEQRVKLKLRDDQTLFGLYEGVPLSQRQGMTHIFPDKITVFSGPLSRSVYNPAELKEAIRHTLWHEIGHYYGLNHDQIHKLETGHQ
jgi:predicted Zn-dependent protease with MMP-like domain